MLNRFHDRFGTAGLVVAVVALIAALAGTAIAAGGLTAVQKKQVIKIAKKYAGKPGPEGPQGPAGTPGANGTNGKDGAAGAPGSNGKSVLATPIPGEPGEECEGVEGTEFEVEGSGVQTYACNGAEGPAGPITGVLPSGVTLTGVWGVATAAADYEMLEVSYGLRLSSAPARHYINLAGKEVLAGGTEVPPSADCDGGTAAVPKAKPGHLCIYTTEVEGAAPVTFTTPISPEPKSGALLRFQIAGVGTAWGPWAVTAP